MRGGAGTARRTPPPTSRAGCASFRCIRDARRDELRGVAFGTAVNHAIARLVPVIATAPADATLRADWLERLFEVYGADQIPYIERLADYWGAFCAMPEVASTWADRLIGVTRLALSPNKEVRGYFHGTSACLSSLFTAGGRYEALIEVVHGDTFWPYKRWAVKVRGDGEGGRGDCLCRGLPRPLGVGYGHRRTVRTDPPATGPQ